MVDVYSEAIFTSDNGIITVEEKRISNIRYDTAPVSDSFYGLQDMFMRVYKVSVCYELEINSIKTKWIVIDNVGEMGSDIHIGSKEIERMM